jgi:phosphonate transport system substrate-binding protein
VKRIRIPAAAFPLLLQALLLASILSFPRPAVAESPLLFGVIPQKPPVEMHRQWAPFVDRLSKDAGVPIRLKVYDSMSDFERDCEEGRPDLIYSHPAMLAAWKMSRGYLPLVRDSRKLSGILFVRKDARIRSAAELADRRIAFVGNRNFCALLVNDALKKQGAPIRFDYEFAGSSRNVLKTVMLGKADAGASLDVDLEREPPEVSDGVRTILKTAPMAPHPISVHPRVPEPVRGRITRAVLAMKGTPEGDALLASIRMGEPVKADYQRDYAALESVTRLPKGR